jgi:DNA-binding transcriptional MerR regulator
MPYNRLSTAKIARAVGCHPNTVRLYEAIGFIAPVPRSPKGYRLYSEAHLDQMRLGRMAMQIPYAGPLIRRSSVAVVKKTAEQDYPAALGLAHRHLEIVRGERAQAEAAADVLEHWARSELGEVAAAPRQIGATARLLDTTIDTLRNWERNGLIDVPRCPTNRYRQYSAREIGRLRVIRLLRQAGYSPMAILRMLLQLDELGAGEDLRQALDTPRPDEDAFSAADRWLSTLSEQEQRAEEMIALLTEMLEKYGPIDPRCTAQASPPFESLEKQFQSQGFASG